MSGDPEGTNLLTARLPVHTNPQFPFEMIRLDQENVSIVVPGRHGLVKELGRWVYEWRA